MDSVTLISLAPVNHLEIKAGDGVSEIGSLIAGSAKPDDKFSETVSGEHKSITCV